MIGARLRICSARVEAAPLVSVQELLSAGSLGELEALYAARGFQGDRRAFLLRAQQDWHRVALAEAKRLDPPAPLELDAVTVEPLGKRVSVHGVIHGMVGGDDPAYKQFVDARLRKLSHTAFENGLSWFYPAARKAVIPDFAVLGVLGSIALGLQVGFLFPRLVWETLRELLKLGRGRDGAGGEELVEYSPRYHGLDPELRRGIEPDPPLPARLQIEYEMGEWDRRGALAALRDPFAIVPRSLYMAGFALGWAEGPGSGAADLVVGDLHTMEVVRFLEQVERWEAHPLFAAGRRFARLSPLRRELTRAALKAVHLAFAALSGAAILIPALLGLLWLLQRYVLP